MEATPAAPSPQIPVKVIAAALAGAAVAVILGVYGNEHEPARDTLPTDLFFSATLNLKVWFATAAFVLAICQVYLGGVMYGWWPYPGGARGWVPMVHRASGFLAFLFTLPVAYHCLYSLGFQDYENGEVPVIGGDRVYFHSILGCIFFGAFAAKVLLVTLKGVPSWALPVAGGILFAALTLIWYTAAYWFFDTRGFPEF
ncbi:MAG: DUF6529 family protein [Dehalococcoidia bacterium]